MDLSVLDDSEDDSGPLRPIFRHNCRMFRSSTFQPICSVDNNCEQTASSKYFLGHAGSCCWCNQHGKPSTANISFVFHWLRPRKGGVGDEQLRCSSHGSKYFNTIYSRIYLIRQFAQSVTFVGLRRIPIFRVHFCSSNSICSIRHLFLSLKRVLFG